MMMSYIDLSSVDDKFKYQLLDRMISDCDYYLGWGKRNSNNLWALNENDHINYMKILYGSFDIEAKPQWITWDEILVYEQLMTTKIHIKISRYSEYGDLVKCNACGNSMIVDRGEDICPMCRHNGGLAWISSKISEVNIDADFIIGMGFKVEFDREK